jgi:hypothetical protein
MPAWACTFVGIPSYEKAKSAFALATYLGVVRKNQRRGQLPVEESLARHVSEPSTGGV